MRSSKIKNIIILMLLLVNAFLLVLVGGRSWHSQQTLRETGERMVVILERNGVEFLPREVPGELELPPRRVQAVPLDREGAALLLGQVKQMEDGRVRTRFAGTMGTAVTTASGEVEVQFLPGSGLDEAAGLALLEQLGVTVEETGRSREGDMTTVLARRCGGDDPSGGGTGKPQLPADGLHRRGARRRRDHHCRYGVGPVFGGVEPGGLCLFSGPGGVPRLQPERQHGGDAVPYLVCGDRRLALAVCGGRRYRSGIGSG